MNTVEQDRYRFMLSRLIPDSRDHFSQILRHVAQRSIEQRCERFSRPVTARMERIVGPMIYAMTEKYWPLDGYALHNMRQVLEQLNVFGGWDRRESFDRTTFGVEEILMEIEPPVVFARLHGSHLRYIDPELLDQFNLRIYAEKYGEYVNIDTPWMQSVKEVVDMSA